MRGLGLGLGFVRRKSGPTYGPDLLTNGDFSSGAGWNTAAGVTISGGLANFNTVSASSALYRSAGVVVGQTYKITVVVTTLTSGTLQPRLFGGLASPLNITAAGTYSFEDTVTAGNTNVGFAAAVCTCSVDSMTLQLKS